MSKEDNKTFINYWTTEVEAGEKYMKKYSTQDKWKEWRQHYRGDWDKDIVPVNRTFSYGRTMIPRVYFRSPRVSITATRPEFVRHAMVVESVDNWLIQELKLKRTLKKAALHAYYCGTAPIKLGFDSEYGYLHEQAVSNDSSTATQLSRTEKRTIEYNTNIKPGLPWALPCMPEDVIIPWGYSDSDNLPWVAHKILRPIEDIKQDQKYKNTEGLTGTKQASLWEKLKSPFTSNKDRPIGELTEIRDYQTHEIIVLCEGKILLKNEDVLQVGGLPWEFLTFNDDPEYFWGIPDVYILEPQQEELNDVKTQQSKHRKIALLKFLYQKGTIKDEELTKFLSGEVGPAVGIDAENIASSIIALQPHMPQDLWKEAQAILNDMDQSMGYSVNQTGGYNPKGGNVSAAETDEVAKGVDLRVDERKDIMSDMLISIVKKWNAMIFTLWDSDRIAEVVGPEGDTEWVSFKGNEIKCEYKLKIDPDSGFPMTGNAKRQLADGLFKTYGGDPMVDQMKLRQYHLDKYENIAPGVLSILRNPATNPEDPNALLGAARQPSPLGAGSQTGAGSSSGSNRGGGKKPMNFEQFAKGGQGK